ncbi:TPA: stress response small protein YobI [Escherichia coli]|nr:stress response small protein YobI [Escherichia coli]
MYFFQGSQCVFLLHIFFAEYVIFKYLLPI